MFSTQSQKLETKILEITPEMADFVLENKNISNRNITKSTVDSYADDILNGNWEITNQAVGFYKDGVLADGQHRLSAIVKAGIPVKTLVTFGLEKTAINGIDQHKVRVANDIMTMKGTYGKVSSTDVAVVRLCLNKEKPSLVMIENGYNTIVKHLSEVNSWFPSVTRTSSAPIRASLVLGLIRGRDKDRLQEFAEILTTGVTSDPTHEIILKLRDEIIKNGVQGGSSQRKIFVKRLMYVMEVFLNNESRKRITTPTEFIYPLINLEKE